MSIFKLMTRGLLVLVLAVTAACGTTVKQVQGDRTFVEVVTVPGGMSGLTVTAGVADYTDTNGNVKTQDFLVTSTPFMQNLVAGLVPGMAVALIQQQIAEYQVDNACTTCGPITNILAASNSATLTQVEVDAIAHVQSGGGH